MQDKAKDTTKKKPMSPEQRGRRTQQIMFGALALIMIVTMIVSLIK